MSKREFLDKLNMALSGKVSPVLVRENLTYYNEYIDSQLAMGKSEQEVMNMLGDPRLIARTIIQTNGTEADSTEDAVYRETYSDSGSNGNGAYNRLYSEPEHQVKVRTIPAWLWMIILILVLVCVLSFVFSVVSFLLPLVLPVLIVLFFVKLFRDWLN